MTLRDVIERLEEQDPHATIYAAKPWSADARAVVAMEPADGSTPRAAAGLDYFLEVAVALEAALVSEARTRFERVLHYAENDAFLFDGSRVIAAPSRRRSSADRGHGPPLRHAIAKATGLELGPVEPQDLPR